MQIFLTFLLSLSFVAFLFNFTHFYDKRKALEGIAPLKVRLLIWFKELLWEFHMSMIYDFKKWMLRGDMPPFKEYLHHQKKIREAGHTDSELVELTAKALFPLISSVDYMLDLENHKEDINK